MEYEHIMSIRLLKKILCSMIVYLIGYFQYSIIWAVLPVIIELLREKHLKRKKIKGDFVRNIASNEEKDILQSIGHLPAWVCFPDIERVEWVNKIIKRLWPNVNNYVHDIIKQLLQEKLNKKLEKYQLSGLVFDKLIVGTVPFRIGGIIVYENVSKDEIILDIDIMYAGDCEIMLRFSKLSGGIKDFELYGRLRIIIKPLIDTLPLAGGLQIFFLNPPDIEFNLEGLVGILELPLLKTKIPVSELIKRKSANEWLNLEDVEHGQILIRSSWLTLTTNYQDLGYVLNEIQLLQVPTLSSAILIVFVDSATDIVDSSHVSRLTHVEIQLEKEEKTTKISKRCVNPVWEEGFTFLVRKPESSYITFRVIDNLEKETLGIFTYHIKALLEEDSFQISKQTFKLMQSESKGKIKLSMKLRVLKNLAPISEDQSLKKNQTRHDSYTKTELSERRSLSLSSSVSSISDNSASIGSIPEETNSLTWPLNCNYWLHKTPSI